MSRQQLHSPRSKLSYGDSAFLYRDSACADYLLYAVALDESVEALKHVGGVGYLDGHGSGGKVYYLGTHHLAEREYLIALGGGSIYLDELQLPFDELLCTEHSHLYGIHQLIELLFELLCGVLVAVRDYGYP